LEGDQIARPSHSIAGSGLLDFCGRRVIHAACGASSLIAIKNIKKAIERGVDNDSFLLYIIRL
jgi:ammonia channel protein AmtB